MPLKKFDIKYNDSNISNISTNICNDKKVEESLNNLNTQELTKIEKLTENNNDLTTLLQSTELSYEKKL